MQAEHSTKVALYMYIHAVALLLLSYYYSCNIGEWKIRFFAWKNEYATPASKECGKVQNYYTCRHSLLNELFVLAKAKGNQNRRAKKNCCKLFTRCKLSPYRRVSGWAVLQVHFATVYIMFNTMFTNLLLVVALLTRLKLANIYSHMQMQQETGSWEKKEAVLSWVL